MPCSSTILHTRAPHKCLIFVQQRVSLLVARRCPQGAARGESGLERGSHRLDPFLPPWQGGHQPERADPARAPTPKGRPRRHSEPSILTSACPCLPPSWRRGLTCPSATPSTMGRTAVAETLPHELLRSRSSPRGYPLPCSCRLSRCVKRGVRPLCLMRRSYGSHWHANASLVWHRFWH